MTDASEGTRLARSSARATATPSTRRPSVSSRLALAAVLWIALLVPGASGAEGQVASPGDTRVEVRLEVSESTGDLFRARFDSALSALDRVEVVGRGDLADYAVTVAVLCLPEAEVCGSASAYTVAVTLSEPLTPVELRSGLGRTGTDALSGWRASDEAAAYLQRYRRMHATWSTHWDRDRYGAAVDRLVRGIDARCFEKRRIYETRRRALLVRGDTAAARDLPADVVPGQDWLC